MVFLIIYFEFVCLLGLYPIYIFFVLSYFLYTSFLAHIYKLIYIYNHHIYNINYIL